MNIRSITICVEYSDLLAITLPRNLEQFDFTLVVTSPLDSQTIALVRHYMSLNHRVGICKTNAFYANGAAFNKGAALEAGYDQMERRGWFCAWDADTLLPQGFRECVEAVGVACGCLYGPRRRMLRNPHGWLPGMAWSSLPPGPVGDDAEFPGYCHIFHADDPHLEVPWNATTVQTCAVDSWFQERWPVNSKERLEIDVLHLGDDGVNWCGRTTPFLDGTIPRDAALRRQRLASIRADAAIIGKAAHLI